MAQQCISETHQDKKTKQDDTLKKKFYQICGFEINDLLSWDKFVRLMYRPTDPSSLGVTRIFFGKYP